MRNDRKDAEPLAQFRLLAADAVSASNLVAAISTVVFYEGLKSLVARERLGLPEPKIEGKPLSRFMKVRFDSGADMQALSIYWGRRTGLGALWIAHNPTDAPDGALNSDAEAAAAFLDALDSEEA